MSGWNRWAEEANAATARSGQWRRYRPFDAFGTSGEIDVDGSRQRVTSFAGNDYLGLSAHPQVITAAHRALDRWGTGSGASRLVTGSRPVHHELEAALAAWKGTERAVLFPTGYAANLGLLATLADARTLICSDELNHASIVDGSRLARAEVAVYPHRDVDAIDRLLARADSDGRRALVVSDSVFSMDGDLVDIGPLTDVVRRHRALLVLDEAHAVLGPDPTPDQFAGVDVIRVGTLSKALGALGGFVACSQPVAELLVNRARPSIFTTASSPADAAAALAALAVLRSAEGARLVAQLRVNIDRIVSGHPSPIVPIVLGDEQAALDASARLLEQGLLVPAIRPPTVAPGTSRLRVTLSAAHTDRQVGSLRAALDALHPAAATPAAQPAMHP